MQGVADGGGSKRRNKPAHTKAAMAAIMVPGLFQRMDDHMTGVPECSSNNFAPMPSPRGSLESCGGMRPDARVRPLRKCASTPTLHSMLSPSGGSDTSTSGAEEQGMEVYVVLRPFKEFGGGMFNRMPRRVRAGVRDAGICHYLAVFKQRDGSLVQFDFGPRGGGDIHVAQGPFAFLSKSTGGKMQRLVPGEVRERRLSKLPAAHMLVGRTPLTLSDIRAWNSLQQQGCMDYELHRNDCRHYTNCLVQYTTGREQAASAVLSHQFNRARGKGAYGLATGVVRVSQWFTDLANWSKVQLVSNVSMYGMIAMSGQKALARLRPAALLPRAAARLQPVSKALVGPVKQALSGRVRHALVRKPVVVGTTAAVATFAASSSAQAPVLQESVTVGARVAGSFRTAAQATMAAAGTAVYRAGAVTTRTTSQAAVMAGSLAGAASRSRSRQPSCKPRLILQAVSCCIFPLFRQPSLPVLYQSKPEGRLGALPAPHPSKLTPAIPS